MAVSGEPLQPQWSGIFRCRLPACAIAAVLGFLGARLLPADQPVPEPAVALTHVESVRAWRERRDASLRRENSWLTLVGLEWLKEGANRVGSGTGNDIRLPGGPEFWGTVVLDGEKLSFEPGAGEVMVEGAAPGTAVLLADNQGEPTVVRGGSLSFTVIFRGSYALRVQDTQAPARLEFRGIDNYEIQDDWRIDGRFVPGEEGQVVEIANVLGQLEPMPLMGVLEFERAGKTHRLTGVKGDAPDSLWFIFADRTNGHATYGAGRFVYSDGLPRDGRLVVDFNKAYNPPCAFSDYSTCPLPPPQNRLDLEVTAGEKAYHP